MEKCMRISGILFNGDKGTDGNGLWGFLCRALLGALWFVAGSGITHAQSNIVVNPSFEINWTTGWDHDPNVGGSINDKRAAADGVNTVYLGARIWQDLKTAPGRTYKITFALGPGTLEV